MSTWGWYFDQDCDLLRGTASDACLFVVVISDVREHLIRESVWLGCVCARVALRVCVCVREM